MSLAAKIKGYILDSKESVTYYVQNDKDNTATIYNHVTVYYVSIFSSFPLYHNFIQRP